METIGNPTDKGFVLDKNIIYDLISFQRPLEDAKNSVEQREILNFILSTKGYTSVKNSKDFWTDERLEIIVAQPFTTWRIAIHKSTDRRIKVCVPPKIAEVYDWFPCFQKPKNKGKKQRK